MTDTRQTELGSLIGDDEQRRDAIHVAIYPAIASSTLSPGDPVSVIDGLAHRCVRRRSHGIVDPFLAAAVTQGQRFWVMLHPGSISGLRHAWSHPNIEDEAEREAAGNVAPEAVIRRAAEKLGASTDEILYLTRIAIDEGNEYVVLAHDLHASLDAEEMDEYLRAFCRVTGTPANEVKGIRHFLCAC